MAPAGKYITVSNNIFSVADRTGPTNKTADIFMRSLAADAGPRSIGVILCGALSDGTDGVRRFFANAIRTGCVKRVAEPDEMPEIIQAYVSETLSNESKH